MSSQYFVSLMVFVSSGIIILWTMSDFLWKFKMWVDVLFLEGGRGG